MFARALFPRSVMFNCDSRTVVLYSVVVFLFMACAPEKEAEKINRLSFDYASATDGQWDDVLARTKVVRLEVTENSLITRLYKVRYDSEKLFAFDINQQKLFVFDSNGAYLFSLGIGPGAEDELISIRDFEVFENQVYLLGYRNIKIYDFNGEYIENVSIPIEEDINVSSLESDKLTQKYLLDFGEFDLSEKTNLTSSVRSDFEFHDLFMYGQNNICGLTINFYETEEFFFFSTFCSGRIRHNLIYKGSNERIYFDLSSKKNIGVYPGLVHQVKDKYIVSSMLKIDVLSIQQKYAEGELGSMSDDQKLLLESLKDYTARDNPVILLSKLK